MNNDQRTCDLERIELSLQQKLSDEERTAFESHLDECDDCRRRLEATAAGDDMWSGVRDSLLGQQADCPQSGDPALDPGLDSATGGDASFGHDTVLKLLAPTDDDRMLGRLGTYEVVGVVGSGGMGVVLKAFDAALNRYVAIKVLAPHLGCSGTARKRFSREAQAAAAVVHDNVMEIHGVADAQGLPYLVMPYVRGPSLQRRLDDDGPLALVEILRIGVQAAAGLAAAHAQGLVHRDVKPANILLEDGVERVKLTDFGLARAADDASLTRTGVIAGTPQYMSPEQGRGESVDQRSDLFSLGSVLYAMCTGRAPFRAETIYGVLRRIADDEPRSIRELNPNIPEWLCRIIARLMSKQPDDRHESAREVAELLEECLAHVQQPTVVALPASLVTQSSGSRLFSISRRALGVIAMIAALGSSLLGMVLWQAAEPPDIAGKWTGEEWGEVVLKQADDGEYTGTYTDTFERQPGEIQLKWSRIERRFNGTWREGEDHFGELSLRLAGNEIRGARATDSKSKVNPAKPRLADVAWTKTAAISKSMAAPPPQAAFSPVRERVLPFGAPCMQKYFQFRTGDVFEIGDGPGDTSDHAEQYQRADSTGGLDASVEGRKEGIRLLGEGCIFTKDGSPNWDTQTAQQTVKQLQRTPWTSGVIEVEEKDFPATYLFKTARGECGILQILGVTGDERGYNTLGMKFRYKLVQSTARPKPGKNTSHPTPLGKDATAASILAQLKNPPEGWKVVESATLPEDEVAKIGESLGGRIKRISYTKLLADDEPLEVKVMECRTAHDAENIRRPIHYLTGLGGRPSGLCLRFGDTVVEFDGGNRLGTVAKAATEELGFAIEAGDPAPEELREDDCVLLVVGKDRITFEGRSTSWDELRGLLEEVSDRQQKVFTFARTTSDMIINEWNYKYSQVVTRVEDLNFKGVSFVGERPLGAQGMPYVRLVIAAKDQMTLEGHKITQSELISALIEVPDRHRTTLEINRASGTGNQMSIKEWNNLWGQASTMAHGFGFKGVTLTGEKPLGSKALPESTEADGIDLESPEANSSIVPNSPSANRIFGPGATLEVIVARLTHPPQGWKVVKLAGNTPIMGGRVEQFLWIVLSKHGKRIVVIVQHATTADQDLGAFRDDVLRDAVTLSAITSNTPLPFTCLTQGRTAITCHAGDEMDRATLNKTIRELGLEASEVPLWADLPKQRELRRHNHVQLIVSKEKMTLEREPTTWEDLRNMLTEIPDRQNTILHIARSTDDWDIAAWNDVEGRISGASRDLGFESTSSIGAHPLGSTGTLSFQLLIADEEIMTPKGREERERELLNSLMSVPERNRTILEIVRTPGGNERMSSGQWELLRNYVETIADRLGFKDTTCSDEVPPGSKVSADQADSGANADVSRDN